MDHLRGKRALIVGASRGIGAATAEILAAGGADVALAARSTAAIVELSGRLHAGGAKAIWVQCDVANDAAVAAMVERVVADLGGIDILVNNAGVIQPIGRLGETDPEVWAANVQTNLIGAFHVLHHTLPRLPGGGTIVNMSSGAAGRPMAGWSAYCSAKAGLAMLSRMIHLEYPDLRVFSFRPGVVDTEMQVQIRASGVNRVSQLTRADLAPPSDPARFVAWLCSAEADDLIGQEIDIRTEALRVRSGLA